MVSIVGNECSDEDGAQIKIPHNDEKRKKKHAYDRKRY